MSRETIFEEIHKERDRQDMKWGEQNHPILPLDPGLCEMKIAVKMAKEKCDYLYKTGQLTWYHILLEEFCETFAEVTPERQREELVQVATVAVSMIECIDRNKE